MEKCLTPEERQGKEVVIKYLRGELKDRMDYLNGEPDNLCKACVSFSSYLLYLTTSFSAAIIFPFLSNLISLNPNMST